MEFSVLGYPRLGPRPKLTPPPPKTGGWIRQWALLHCETDTYCFTVTPTLWFIVDEQYFTVTLTLFHCDTDTVAYCDTDTVIRCDTDTVLRCDTDAGSLRHRRWFTVTPTLWFIVSLSLSFTVTSALWFIVD